MVQKLVCAVILLWSSISPTSTIMVEVDPFQLFLTTFLSFLSVEVKNEVYNVKMSSEQAGKAYMPATVEFAKILGWDVTKDYTDKVSKEMQAAVQRGLDMNGYIKVFMKSFVDFFKEKSVGVLTPEMIKDLATKLGDLVTKEYENNKNKPDCNYEGVAYMCVISKAHAKLIKNNFKIEIPDAKKSLDIFATNVHNAPAS